MLASGEQGVERRLLQGSADSGTHVRAFGDDVVAGDASRARGRRQQGRQHVNRRRLAGAVQAQEAVDLPWRDSEVDRVDGARAVLELPDELGCLNCVIAHRRTSLPNCLMLSNTYWFK